MYQGPMEVKAKPMEEAFSVGFTLSSVSPWSLKISRRKLRIFHRLARVDGS
jgi:hypothetical protein